MVDLRAYAIIDNLQNQFVGFIGSTARGYYPVAGQAAMFIEVAPGTEINTLTDVVLKRANVLPGAMVVERSYGMLEIHGDSPADVEDAGQVLLSHMGLQNTDRLKPLVLSSVIIERTDAYMAQIVNRFRNAGMARADETLYTLEVVPAGYAGYAANEAEKAADIRLIHVTVFGATGRVYLAGDISNVMAAREAAENALAKLEGREHH